jgi:hypothetical protein
MSEIHNNIQHSKSVSAKTIAVDPFDSFTLAVFVGL